MTQRIDPTKASAETDGQGAARSAPRGTIILVVGPSGSGKDSILSAAEAVLGNDGEFFFPRRDVTRPAALGGEPYCSVSAGEFQHRRSHGAYSLSWFAHGLGYGVPQAIEQQLSQGRHVVVNVSRAVIPEVRRRLQPACVVSIEVPSDVLRARLAARERETAEEIEARLERAAAFDVQGSDVTHLQNDTSLETAVARFVTLLRKINRAKESAPAH